MNIEGCFENFVVMVYILDVVYCWFVFKSEVVIYGVCVKLVGLIFG